MIQEKVHIPVTKTARYFKSGNSESDTTWYLIHGYGQLAIEFLDKFKSESFFSFDRFESKSVIYWVSQNNNIYQFARASMGQISTRVSSRTQ